MNIKTRHYKVADHCFSVTAEEGDLELMTNYKVFQTTLPDDIPPVPEGEIFALTIEQGEAIDYTEEIKQEEEGQNIICGRRTTDASEDGEASDERQPVFEFQWDWQTAGWLVCSPDYRKARLIVTGYARKMAIDNALMVLYALTTAVKGTVLFHAAVVSHEGPRQDGHCPDERRGYMFLGKSGTGKSTHASLWGKYIEGTELVNDDNPVVRVTDDGQAVVYGSPWSGKTPCYRNVSYPVGGIVMLSQAPYNKITPLKSVEAYIALMTSISGMRWDEKIAEGLHQTENALASHIPIWHLECLPDEAAARLCQTTIEKR